MLTSILDVAPIVMMIGIGVLLRVTGLLGKEGRLALTRIAYYVTIPTAITLSIARADITPELLLLPLLGLVVPIILVGVIYLTTPRLAQEPRLRGAMMVCMVGLVVFGYPFAELFYGVDGMARLALYDVGNVLFIATLALWIAKRYGDSGEAAVGLQGLTNIFKSPFIYSAALGIAASLLHIEITGPIGRLLEQLAQANTPVAMMAVGSYLSLKAARPGRVAQVAAVRMLLGGALAWGLGLLVGLRGLNLVLATMAASLPVGTTPLIYAGNEGLDAEFAAAAISFTVILGAILVNVVPHMMAGLYL